MWLSWIGKRLLKIFQFLFPHFYLSFFWSSLWHKTGGFRKTERRPKGNHPKYLSSLFLSLSLSLLLSYKRSYSTLLLHTNPTYPLFHILQSLHISYTHNHTNSMCITSFFLNTQFCFFNNNRIKKRIETFKCVLINIIK